MTRANREHADALGPRENSVHASQTGYVYNWKQIETKPHTQYNTVFDFESLFCKGLQVDNV